MIEFLYIIGAISSIIGALFSVKYANTAKEYANQARKQIAHQRRLLDLSQLQLQWKTIYKALAPFGPGSRVQNLSGKNPTKPARIAQDYIEDVKKCSSIHVCIPDIDKRFEKIKPLLVAFSDARNADSLKTTGTQLLEKLGDLNAAISSALLSHKEQIELV